ncbi:hypothetical protein AVEN_12524-1 [Araneus ventricosus]|uniref:Uncharacterized protein n=1 Tax=Araneus ventricosus TaxID=182803 RepID=A0A4Y2IP72_ARAVE|nr:hypothetical protein AVEN_12524-1 [Araneus ventricosus]
MTAMALELHSPSPNFRTIPETGRFTHEVRFNMHHIHMHGGFSVESGFEPGALCLPPPRSCDFTTRPSSPQIGCEGLSVGNTCFNGKKHLTNKPYASMFTHLSQAKRIFSA